MCQLEFTDCAATNLPRLLLGLDAHKFPGTSRTAVTYQACSRKTLTQTRDLKASNTLSPSVISCGGHISPGGHSSTCQVTPHLPTSLWLPSETCRACRGCCGALRMGLHGECCAQSLLLVPSSSGTQAQLRAGVGKGQQPLCRCREGSCATGEGPSCSAHGGEGSGTAGGKWAGGMRYTRAVLINS